MSTQALDDGHAAFSTHTEAVEVEPVGLQGEGLLHGCHQMGVAAPAVGGSQQCQHQRIAAASREGQRPAIGILQSDGGLIVLLLQ